MNNEEQEEQENEAKQLNQVNSDISSTVESIDDINDVKNVDIDESDLNNNNNNNNNNDNRKQRSRDRKSQTDKPMTSNKSRSNSKRRRKNKKSKDSHGNKNKSKNKNKNKNKNSSRKNKKKNKNRASSSSPARSSTKSQRNRKGKINNDGKFPESLIKKRNKDSKKLLALDNEEDDNKGLPVITEEDNESNFSATYVPTTFNISAGQAHLAQFYLGDKGAPAPVEDRIVRVGPSLWHWNWDLSFGLYDELYDNLPSRLQDGDMLEDTWLKYEGPIPSWQPLFAALLWFISAMSILYPVSLISQIANTSWDDHEKRNASDIKSFVIHSPSAYILMSSIFAFYELVIVLCANPARWLILHFGPSMPLVGGLFIMCASQFFMGTLETTDNYTLYGWCLFIRGCCALGFVLVRECSMFFWPHFSKLDMFASGIGFLLGPTIGDILFRYQSWRNSFFVYGALLAMCFMIAVILVSGKYLSSKDVARNEVPNHVQKIRKPRQDLLHFYIRSVPRSYVYVKGEILFAVVIVVTSLEPLLPSYCVNNPSLNVSVSGTLFTLFYVPLLAIGCVIGLLYSKSSLKLFDKIQNYLDYRRRGMPYVTKTLSLNVNPVGKKELRKKRNGSKIPMNVRRLEKIKVVEKPAWLMRRKKELPSPEISQHHIGVFCGLLLLGLGYIILAADHHYLISQNDQAIDLVIGLLLISIGCGIVIVSCCDSLINGLAIHTNQVQLLFTALHAGVILGPMFGGILVTLTQSFSQAFLWTGLIMLAHCVWYLLYKILYYVYRKIRIKWQISNELKNKETQKQSGLNKNQVINLTTTHGSINGNIYPSINSVTVLNMEQNNLQTAGTNKKSMSNDFDKFLSFAGGSIISNDDAAVVNSRTSFSSTSTVTYIPPQLDNTNQQLGTPLENSSIIMPPSVQDKPDSVTEPLIISNETTKSQINTDSQKIIKNEPKRRKLSISKVFVYGKNLRHLCWWKRGLHVRFPYVQWLDSGWSANKRTLEKKEDSIL